MTQKNQEVIELDQVVIRFSGDSGDGMQLTGTLFSEASALFGNDVATFPDFPAEIRAPQGTVGGVSGFQVHFGHSEIKTPGDFCDVLVAMNPAALKANRRWLKQGAIVILNSDEFNEKQIIRAGYFTEDPITEDNLHDFNLIYAPINTMVKEALSKLELDNKSTLRCKNMFALGMCYWLFNRPMENTMQKFEKKFAKKPILAEANIMAMKAGYNYADSLGIFPSSYKVLPAEITPGKYRTICGNTGVAWGFAAAAEKSGLNLFCGSYPITPATEILVELSHLKNLGIKALQVEDEIAGICTAIGASFAGNLAVTTTSGPGLSLKSEAINLAVIAELPLVIVDVQRGGPSTGLPTKTEQSDLLQALYGRNGESPIAVIAASTPSDCFYYAFIAAKIAVEHMMPVILLTDGYIGNGSAPFRIPKMADLPAIHPPIVKEGTEDYQPYRRNPETMARYWAVPGTKGLEHRVGGLEKMAITGTVSYVPENHEIMTKERASKVAHVLADVPDLEVEGDGNGELLVIGWGSTYGHLISAVNRLRKHGKKLALAHFNYINPLPSNTEEILRKYKKIVVCEINMGQFVQYMRTKFSDIEFMQYNKIQGLPFTEIELIDCFNNILEG
ncbi:MAG: 2-oxoacid:acceptor oxidoreductase subunit alpha [Bacteroidales bacterium]|jgi:2-oxoglutarate ferredoxin oxidoreductase subunit alpha|nr:2-oxoacid:acceptor oxidoreductase subunit alpha [Bacteroidales bacterium]